jgi:hypothetical protein
MRRNEPQPHRFPTVVDVIDRVLDKGIVIEYHARVSIGGIDTLMTIDGRYITTSFDTHARYAELLRSLSHGPIRWPSRLFDAARRDAGRCAGRSVR